MVANSRIFEQSIQRQIALNQARTPSERFAALCDLLDVAREMAPKDAEARERRLRALLSREHDREQWRAQCRRFAAAERSDPSAGV